MATPTVATTWPAMAMAMAMAMSDDDMTFIPEPSEVYPSSVRKRVGVGAREAENGTSGVGSRREREHAEQPRLVA